MMKISKILMAIAAVMLCLGSAQAQQASINVRPKPVIVTASGVTAECAWTPGTKVLTYQSNVPVVWSLSGDPTGSFVLDTSSTAATLTDVIVGTGGVAAALCGTVVNVSVGHTP